MPCARLSPLSETSELPVDRFSGSLAVSRTMAAGRSAGRPTELSPVGGNRRGADVRQVLGCYLGGDGWGGDTSICEPIEVSSAVREDGISDRDCPRSGSCGKQTNPVLHPTIGATIMPLAFYNPVLGRVRERRRYAHCVAIVRYFAFPDSSSGRLRTIASPSDWPKSAERFVHTHSTHFERIGLSHYIDFQDLEWCISIQDSTIALLVSAEI